MLHRPLHLRHLLVLLIALASPLVVFAGETFEQIRQRGEIRVGLEGTYPPFSFQDERGQLSGFEVEFSQALAKELGVRAALQPTKWDGILAALESGRLDVVINQVTITEERRRKYDFSEPYTVSGIQALVRKGQEGFARPADLAGKRVGVGLGTNYEQWLRENVPDAVVRTYDDDPTKYQDLRVGRIDTILVDRLAAFELMRQTGGALVLSGEPFARQEAGVAMRKGDPELLQAINAAIETLRADGTLADLSRKWFDADVTE
ncbi:MAG TPA: cystine ABC transporter substrate-binding protein [Pseudomonas sp.]|nr:cystine ABC transporter substrate-binding protein [Pseudomonas sp.]